MYHHVIWDWNGTLLDDAWLSLEIINRLLEQRGLPRATPQRYREVFGFPLEEYCRMLGFDFQRESYETLNDAFMEIYERRRFECRLQEDARGTLAAIQGQGVEQSLLSAYKQETLEEMVDHFELTGFFSAVVGVDNHYGAGKVECGKRRKTELAYAADQILLIGDTLHDLEVARAMGVHCALFPSGHQQRQRLQAGGVRVIDSLRQAPSLVGTGIEP